MSITIDTTMGSKTLKENFEGYQAGIDESGPYVLKTYTAPDYASAFACVNALRGTASVTGGIGGTIVRALPHQPPESPGLYALSVVLDPQSEIDAKDDGRPRFNLPIIHVRYGVPRYEVQSSDDPGGINSFPNDDNPGSPYTFAMQSIDISTEYIKLPGSAYKFHTAPQHKLDTPVAGTIATANLVFIRKYIPYLPFNLVTQKLNGLNDATFLGQPRGLIKFTGARTRREFLSDGKVNQEIEVNLRWRQYDHNKQHRPDESSFDFIEDDSGNMPYTYRDLRPLVK